MIIASIYPPPFHIGLGHDANATILSPTEVFSCEEGKLIRESMPCFPGFPQRALAAAFRHHRITPRDVDHWVFGRPGNDCSDRALHHFFHSLKLPSRHARELEAVGQLHFVDHHTAHAALAACASGFERGCFLTYDGGGDESQPCVMTHGRFDDGRLKLEGTSPPEAPGIGNLFDSLAAAAGFVAPVETGKFMGLAAYGTVDEQLGQALDGFLDTSEKGRRFALSTVRREKYTPYRFEQYDCDTYDYFRVYYSATPPANIEECTRRHDAADIAATAQNLLEDSMLRVVAGVLRSSDSKNLVLSGGLFQNIRLNESIRKRSGAARVFVPMAPSDSGLSLGAALHVRAGLGETRPHSPMSPYLGPAFSEDEIERTLDQASVQWHRPASIVDATADMIAAGRIVGWFQGRAELGPRALGSRSILADPRNLRSRHRLNQMLKKRDWFMPYAPALLADAMSKYFDAPHESPYMAFSTIVRTDRRAQLAGAVHVDGSCRPQSVSQRANPLFYSLITAFSQRTGVPAVLNTSFNRHGIATIASPRQAVLHLLGSHVEALAVGPFLVEGACKARGDVVVPDSAWMLVEKVRTLVRNLAKDERLSRDIADHIASRFPWVEVSIEGGSCRVTVGDETVVLRGTDRSELRRLLYPLLAGVQIT